MITLTFLFCLLLLFYFSIVDISKEEIENEPIIALFMVGIGYRYFIGDLLALGLGIAILGIISYILWYKKSIGGADVKLLIAIVPFLSFLGTPNMLVTLWFFLIEFLIITVFYSLIWKIVVPKKKKIPFIPAITLTYIVSYLLQFH